MLAVAPHPLQPDPVAEPFCGQDAGVVDAAKG
jgi:hypothetical protein